MRFLIAPDKFKGSLPARTVAENIARGIQSVISDAEIEIAPLADGGEGTAEIICAARGGEWVACAAHNPLGRRIDARYAWLGASATAVFEMSETAGTGRLAMDERDPLRANTFGVGEMILAVQKHGARELIVGLGGSVTNDGGYGMARALGFEFLAGDQVLTNDPAELTKLTRIKSIEKFPLKVIAAVDVRNPLLGANGATRIFGSQKGATPEQIERLENALTRLAEVVAHDLGHDFRNQPGAGAAGGLGFGLLSFCRAEAQPGFEVVSKATGFEQKVCAADFVITGEGKLDAQTLEGKTGAGVSRLSRKYGKPVYAIVGDIEDSDGKASRLFDFVIALARPPITPALSIQFASDLLRERAAEVAQQIGKSPS